jgi:tRNA-Thr(GGU) m(6)t(6)A37 methyltransferase TsaA
MEHCVKFIGTVYSELKRLEDCPLQELENAPEAIIEIFNEYQDTIQNVKPGAEMILFTWLHRADRSVLVTRPRNNPNAPLTGVFSTRSPDRPNPIGIHFVKIISILPGNRFKVSGLEVLDQTPLIDIKPDLNR